MKKKLNVGAGLGASRPKALAFLEEKDGKVSKIISIFAPFT
ncbi:hypothetical protein EZS27_002026 [termite gut metagenome]|uniref:Uncharacterized protein n=1 Tax=termite gut metagenome TaxID=433724 RepID=A0A5J4SYW2_9ZZZZ